MQESNPYAPSTAQLESIAPTNKRPASVLWTMIVLAVLIVLVVVTAFRLEMFTSESKVFAGLFYLVLHVFPLAGVAWRRNWARIMSALVFLFWGAILLGKGILAFGVDHRIVTFIPNAMLCSPLIYLGVTLFRKHVKAYFVAPA